MLKPETILLHPHNAVELVRKHFDTERCSVIVNTHSSYFRNSRFVSRTGNMSALLQSSATDIGDYISKQIPSTALVVLH
jgi:hypothetical protein